MSISQEIIEKYTISEEKKDEIFNAIIQNLTLNAQPIENPIAIIVGGQCGAGKSGLMAYSHKMFDNRPFLDYTGESVQENWIRDNVIQIEDDEFRAYFPNEKEIALKYPEEYIQITNKLTNEITARVFDYISKHKYNIIFHQTLKNNRIADDGIMKLKDLGYAVVVRALAVNELESRMSMIERSLGQIECKGYCRNVTTADHDNTYYNMPETIDYIENNKRFDVLQVFKRNAYDKIDEPEMVYTITNPNSTNLKLLSTYPYLITFDADFGYKSAKEAVIKTREAEINKFLPNAEIRIGNAKKQKGNVITATQIAELEELMAKLFKSSR